MLTENVRQAISISVTGFAIVFCTLLFLVGVISLIRFLDSNFQEREERHKKDSYNKMQTIDNTTLVLIAAAVATYFKGRALIKRIRVLPDTARRGGSWSMQGRTAHQNSHITKKQ